jgi:hypothetical protein
LEHELDNLSGLDFIADLRFSDVYGNIAVAFFRVGELVVFGGDFYVSDSECFGGGVIKVALVVLTIWLSLHLKFYFHFSLSHIISFVNFKFCIICVILSKVARNSL